MTKHSCVSNTFSALNLSSRNFELTCKSFHQQEKLPCGHATCIVIIIARAAAGTASDGSNSPVLMKVSGCESNLVLTNQTMDGPPYTCQNDVILLSQMTGTKGRRTRNNLCARHSRSTTSVSSLIPRYIFQDQSRDRVDSTPLPVRNGSYWRSSLPVMYRVGRGLCRGSGCSLGWPGLKFSVKRKEKKRLRQLD